MPQLQPFLRLTDKATCAEYTILDNCRTLFSISEAWASPRWEVAADCVECCPECQREESYPHPADDDCAAWWSDTANPAAGEFLGIIADSVYLEPSLSSRRRGDTTLSTPDYTPRRLEITGRIVTASERGTAYAWEQLTKLLAATSCSTGAGWEAEVRAFCPDPLDDPTPPVLDPWVPQVEPALIDDGLCAQAAALADEQVRTPGDTFTLAVGPLCVPCGSCECGPCERQDPSWTPDRLGPATAAPNSIIDSGYRTIMDVRLVAIDTNADSDIPACDGADFTMVFEVINDDWHGEQIAGACTLDAFASQEERCRPYDWAWACRTIPVDTGDGCGIDPLEAAAAVVEVPTISTTSTSASSYCFPLWRSVRSCLVPFIPTRGDVGINFEISAGVAERDVRNLRIEVWAAHEGMFDPATCEGEQYYRAIQPEALVEIPWLPRGAVLSIDSGARRVLRACAGRPFEEAGSSLANAWDFPQLDPGCRYWVVVTADCLNVNADTSVSMSFTPRFVS